MTTEMKLPVAHCAFRGCAWVGGTSDEVDEHLRRAHPFDMLATVGPVDEKDFMGYYCGAIAEVERRRMPRVGVSVDRRTIAHVLEAYNDETIKELMCFVCGQLHGAWGGPNAAIEFRTGRCLLYTSPSPRDS